MTPNIRIMLKLNCTFDRAQVGDTIALSVMTPGHLHKIGLLKQMPPEGDSEYL